MDASAPTIPFGDVRVLAAKVGSEVLFDGTRAGPGVRADSNELRKVDMNMGGLPRPYCERPPRRIGGCRTFICCILGLASLFFPWSLCGASSRWKNSQRWRPQPEGPLSLSVRFFPSRTRHIRPSSMGSRPRIKPSVTAGLTAGCTEYFLIDRGHYI